LNDLSLNIGETQTQTLNLTVADGISLNTTLTATVTASFGSASFPQTQTQQIPVFVAAPGAQAIADASAAVGQLGKADLSNRLNDLSLAMNRLVENADNQVAKSQVLAALDSIIKQLAVDPFLSGFVDKFTAPKLALEAVGTPDKVLATLNASPTALAQGGRIGR
jgi:hypothetical protein